MHRKWKYTPHLTGSSFNVAQHGQQRLPLHLSSGLLHASSAQKAYRQHLRYFPDARLTRFEQPAPIDHETVSSHVLVLYKLSRNLRTKEGRTRAKTYSDKAENTLSVIDGVSWSTKWNGPLLPELLVVLVSASVVFWLDHSHSLDVSG